VNSFENQMISLGVSAASAFSLPKSVGAIFGLIFASTWRKKAQQLAPLAARVLGSEKKRKTSLV